MGFYFRKNFTVFESIVFEKCVVFLLVAFGDQSKLAVEEVGGRVVLGV